MYLTQLAIRRVRNLQEVTIQPVAGLNLIYGANASGKTSLLEAIHLLSHARSFRSADIRTVIQHNSETLQVTGQVEAQPVGQKASLGIEKGKNLTRVRINQQTVHQTSKLAAFLPVQTITPEVHQILEQGPSQRRKFLDWGLFHVEHTFHPLWQQYNRILKQRNAAIRADDGRAAIQLWDEHLAKSGVKLTRYRQDYVSALLPYTRDYVQKLLQLEIELIYSPGWNQDKTLKEALKEGIQSDMKQGFSRLGPHRAELRILSNGIPAKDQFSRGQQKLLVCALRLAQIAHLQESAGQASVVLVDDLAAELDKERRARLLSLLKETGAQIFVTVTEPEMIEHKIWPVSKLFHVKHGKVCEVI